MKHIRFKTKTFLFLLFLFLLVSFSFIFFPWQQWFDLKNTTEIIRISRADQDAVSFEDGAYFKDIRVIPHYVNGVEGGFKFLKIKKGTLFEKIGLQRNDILKSVNGRPLTVRDGFEPFKALQVDSEFVMEIERSGGIRFVKIELY